MPESNLHFETHTSDIAGVAVMVKRTDDDGAAARLRYEGEILARIDHPGVVRLVADGEELGDTALATAVAGSGDLSTTPPDRISDVARTTSSLAATLAELHATGLAHDAVCPEHVVVGPLGRVTLCSFRRAKRIDGVTSPAAQRDAAGLAQLIAWMLLHAPAVSPKDREMATRLAELLDLLGREGASALASITDRLSGPAPAAMATRLPGRRRTGAEPVTATSMTPDRPGLGATVGTMAACLAALVALVVLRPALGIGTAGGPTPVGVAVTVVWAATVLIAIGGLAVHGLGAVALWRDSAELAALVERVAPPRVRRSLASVAAAGVTLTSINAVTMGPDTPAVRVDNISPVRAGTTASSPVTSTSIGAPTTTAVTGPPAPEPTTEPAQSPQVGAAPTDHEWITQAGDHFWHIAEATLATTWGRTPTDTEVDGYWRAVVARNRDRLVDRDNPDLIEVGQRFVLPEVPPGR